MITTPDGNIVFTPDELVKLCEKMGARTACKILGIQSPPPPDIPLNEPVDDDSVIDEVPDADEELTVSDEDSIDEEDSFNDEEELEEEEDEPVLDEEAVDNEELEDESIDDDEPEKESDNAVINKHDISYDIHVKKHCPSMSQQVRLDFFEEGKIEVINGFERRVFSIPKHPWKALLCLYNHKDNKCDYETFVGETINELQRKGRDDAKICNDVVRNIRQYLKKYSIPLTIGVAYGEIFLDLLSVEVDSERTSRINNLQSLYESNSEYSCTEDDGDV